MHISPGVRWVLRIGTAITLAFIYIPLIVIAIYAFNESRSQAVADRRASRSSGSTAPSTTRACATRSGPR